MGDGSAFVATRNGGRDLYRVEVAKDTILRITSGLAIWEEPADRRGS